VNSMSDEVHPIAPHDPSTDKPAGEHKSKRDSAVVISSDPETSSIEASESTGSDDSEEADEDHEENDNEEEGEEKPDIVKSGESETASAEGNVTKEGENKEEKGSEPQEHGDRGEKEVLHLTEQEPEHKSEDTEQHLTVSESPTKKEEEVDDDSISTTVETGEPIEDVPLKQTIGAEGGGAEKEEQSSLSAEKEIKEEEPSIVEEGGSKDDVGEQEEPDTNERVASEVGEGAKKIEKPALVEAGDPEKVAEEIAEEKAAESLEPTAVAGEKESKEISPKAEDPAKTEQDPASPATAEEPLEEKEKHSDQLVDTNAADSATTSSNAQAPVVPSPSTQKPTPSTLQISRSKFRQALNMLIQLLSEAEDDDGVVHLNLNDKESELRKVVRMLGKRLEGLEEVEREVEWVGLVGMFEERREKDI
jgi:hypothetical protein